ncbi:MAG: nitroreductase family protein [Eubacteriales bacterium]
MNLLEAMKQRHSVRQYQEQPLAPESAAALREEIEACNRESGLHIQLVTDEPAAFSGFMAHYGKFSGVTNYIALVGKKSPALDEACGYYGERLVLKAQQLGLNTCWVALTYRKVPGVFQIASGEKLTVVIAVGYGKTQGSAHSSKTPEQVSGADGTAPAWFQKGVEAALLAPTAMNQQQFYLKYVNNKVTAQAKPGFYSKVDLGIVKYHFELGAGGEKVHWG